MVCDSGDKVRRFSSLRLMPSLTGEQDQRLMHENSSKKEASRL
jgi:hypothetical protein